MGADGGVMWMRIRNWDRFKALTGWIEDSLFNRQSNAMRGYEFAIDPTPPEGEGWIEGGYGTDCDFCLEDLATLVSFLTAEGDPDPIWLYRSGPDDIRDCTLGDLPLAWLTEPYPNSKWDWRHEMQILRVHLKNIPEELKPLTLREWAQQIKEVADLDNLPSQETWT